MNALSHSLTHRGSSAGTRARSRWQPYASSSITPTRSPAPYLNTPSSSVSSSPPQLSRSSHISQDIHRQALKSRYVALLIDQTVTSLCEIWQCHHIPSFTSVKTVQIASAIYQEVTKCSISDYRNTQLPSPISPSTHPTPPQSPFPITTCIDSSPSSPPSTSPVPLRSFVQEVLRRSRTSGSVLQTALCYLEAVRRKVSQIARQVEVEVEESSQMRACSNDTHPHPLPSPERPFASPLLCPRRTFLASLILASKFLQDRCYSNRAWAKLSGLSPREIGRCEKALGDALEWRLWVGKGISKPLARSRSEHDVAFVGVPRSPSCRTLARANTVPSLGTAPPCDQWAYPSFVSSQPQSDPYQEWLALNQSRLREEEESLPMTPFDGDSPSIQNKPTVLSGYTPIPPTPALILSPTSTRSSSSVLSYDSDEGERTIQVADISEPVATRLSARYGWYDRDGPNHGICLQVFDPTGPPVNQQWF